MKYKRNKRTNKGKQNQKENIDLKLCFKYHCLQCPRNRKCEEEMNRKK